MKSPAPTLEYQRTLDRDQLTVEEIDGVTRIFTVPLKTWKRAKYFRRAVYAIGTLAALLAAAAIHDVIKTRDALMLVPAGEVTFVGIIIFLYGWMRIHQSFVIVVNHQQVQLIRRSHAHSISSVSYRRDLIGQVHVNLYNNQVAIPVLHHPQVEFYVSDERQETQRVVDAIDAAIARHSPDVDRSAPEITDERVRGNPSETRRTALLIVLICAAAVSAYATIWLGVWEGLGIFIACLIPCGIVLGTQEKKFWM